MSLHSDDQSQYSSVPPSAQPYRSLFGGSSQVTSSQDQTSQFRDGKALNQLDGAPAVGGPIAEYEEFDDDLDYIQTSDRESSTSSRKHDSAAPQSSALQSSPILKKRESPESSTSPPPYRPNRFHGPAHQWLSLTREDRDIAEALQETGARDLAAHLYNAHALQVQGLARLEQVNADHPAGDKTNDNETENEAFLNNLEDWTAWPMPSDEVPRADERLRRLEDDRWTFRMKPDSRPSAGLEESMTAFLTRTAKERFQSRGWESSGFTDRKGAQLDVDEARSGTEDVKTDREDADEEMQNVDLDSVEEGLPLLRPVAQIDDDEARRKLRPLTRNAITQLDQLLMGLHRFHGAFESVDGRSNRSRSRSRNLGRSSSLASDRSSVYSKNADIEDESHHATTGTLKRSSPAKVRSRETPERSHSRGRKRTRISSQSSRRSSTHAEGADRSAQGARPTSANHGARPGLTDWRDVAGIASMIGLPSAVLQRAIQRFSTLVGEDMNLPFITGIPSQPSMEIKMDSSFAEYDDAPHSAVPSRHASARKRSPSPVDRAVLKTTEKPSLFRKNSTKEDHNLVCPFKQCNRHTKGFSRRWNLNQHLKTMHPSYQLKDNTFEPAGVQSGGGVQSGDGVQSGYGPAMSE